MVFFFSADGFKVGCDWARAVFNVDASYVSVGSADGTVFIWDVETGNVEGLLKNEHTLVSVILNYFSLYSYTKRYLIVCRGGYVA